ncbi:hypothetical protein HAX54_012429 [Datura stramonium]|uniref:Uncharacterized protein n=1 Tax=Datura stramonium TaxID=4076 RepID=A0ABS8Y137_DATST|nr:hypothetical protein [Datura stramonium]
MPMKLYVFAFSPCTLSLGSSSSLTSILSSLPSPATGARKGPYECGSVRPGRYDIRVRGSLRFHLSFFNLVFMDEERILIASNNNNSGKKFEVEFRQVWSSQVLGFRALTLVFPFSVRRAARALSC